MSDKVRKVTLLKNRRQARQKGQPYTTSSGTHVAGKKPPSPQVSCSCKYACKAIPIEQKQLLFMKFYQIDEKSQNNYLLNRIQMQTVGRRRNGKYDDPAESRRQCTFSYVLPDGSGNNVQVCSRTFKEIFAVTPKKLQVLQCKKKAGCLNFEDGRGRNPESNKHKIKFTEDDRNLVRAHINSFPRYESHYSRHKSKCEFLSPDLNIHRLFQAFKTKYPQTEVSYRYYSKVFHDDFPKLKFKHPAVDTCNKCDLLKVTISSTSNKKEKAHAITSLEIHHRKSEKAQKIMKEDMLSAQLPDGSFTAMCMDLQQVMFVPMLTHNQMFYSRQLSTYNLGIHFGDSGSSYMCMWHEGVGGRGANEIASCFFKIATSGLLTRKRLVLWCDNCGSQNKNQMLLMAIVYLVHKKFYRSIDIKYLVVGHTYMACDRDFGVIEKRRRTSNAMVPEDLEEVVRTARSNNPFKVQPMKTEDFIDFGMLSAEFFNTTDLKISKVCHIQVSHKKPYIIKTATSFASEDDIPTTWRKTNVLKPNKDLESLPSIEKLPRIDFTTNISAGKKKDLLKMIPFLKKPEDRFFYQNILNISASEEEIQD